MPKDDLSLSEARRIALAAQGFDRPRPSRAPTARDVERTIAQLGLIQIDYVNVTAAGYQQTPGGWKLIATKRIGTAGQWSWYATEVCGLTATQLKPLPSPARPACSSRRGTDRGRDR